jgi:hypothetical protein
MSMKSLYRAFNLQIRSTLLIPGAQRLDHPESRLREAADLAITEGRVKLASPWLEAGPYRTAGGSLLFEKPGVARYLCEDKGASIMVEEMAGASQAHVLAMLAATTLPAALWMRGDLVLHAAAAILPGHQRATVFAGPSGIGKSTLLRKLLARGAVAVSDDVLCVRWCGSTVEGSGLPACTFLRHPGQTGDSERSAIATPPAQRADWAELGAIVTLQPGSAHRLSGSFERLRGAESLAALLRHRHRPRIPLLLGMEPLLLSRFIRLVQALPVYSWNYNNKATGSLMLRDLANVAPSPDSIVI